MKLFVQNYLIRIAVITIALMLSACGEPGLQKRAWTEDVLLDDGTTIVVKRAVAFKETNSLGGDAYNAVETESNIEFTADLNQLPPWSQPLMALVMYHDKTTNEWVVVATTTSDVVWQERGRPCPSYWEYRLAAEGWKLVPLQNASIGRSANLLRRYQEELKIKHVTMADKEQMQKPGRPFASMSPIEKSFRVILNKSDANCSG
jgi:hypothetical protein